jgi:thioredoxin 1
MAVITATDSDFNSLLASNEKVVVKFFADWCGSCKLFAPKFKRLSNDERFAGTAFLEVDAENNEQARKLAGVDNLPFMATFKNGVLVKGEATSLEDRVVSLIEEIK